jgi:hypothetical protein
MLKYRRHVRAGRDRWAAAISIERDDSTKAVGGYITKLLMNSLEGRCLRAET